MEITEAAPESLLSKACRVMMTFRPCTIIFRNGTDLKCERLIKTSVTIVGDSIGSITVIVNGRSEEIIADYIADILQ